MHRINQKIGVVILNWNGFQDTKECIESLFKSTYKNYFVVVVDNNSESNDAAELKKIFGDKIYLVKNKKNLGYCGGNNVGFNVAKKKGADSILILNNDTELESECVTVLERELSSDKDLTIVGATIMDFYDRSRIQCRGLTFSKWTGISMAIDQGRLFKDRTNKSPSVVSGACFLIKADFCDNLFDEDFFCYYDDTDLSLRVSESGKRFAVLSKALVYHKGSVSANKIGGFTEFQLIRNRFRVIEKHAIFPQKLTFLIITLLLYTPFRIVVLFITRKAKNVPYYFKGLSAGIFNFKFL